MEISVADDEVNSATALASRSSVRPTFVPDVQDVHGGDQLGTERENVLIQTVPQSTTERLASITVHGTQVVFRRVPEFGEMKLGNESRSSERLRATSSKLNPSSQRGARTVN